MSCFQAGAIAQRGATCPIWLGAASTEFSVLATHGLGRLYILPAEWAKLIANMPKVTDRIL
jgi:hypothetical protein